VSVTEVYLSRTGQGFAAGDLVVIEQGWPNDWEEAQGQVGLILELTGRWCSTRQHSIRAAKVMVLGEVAEFDINELEVARVV
jgi:hypothetical protein